MADKVILSEPYGAVFADDAVPCVVVQFHDFANREQFKNIMSTGLACYLAHSQPGAPWGWVGDTRRMGAIPKEVQQWLTDEWNKQAFAAGIREISIVVSENVFGQLATQQYVQQTTAVQDAYELIPRYYKSLEEAKQGAAQRLTTLKS